MADTVTTLTQSMKIFFEEQKIALMDFVDLFFPTRFTTDADTIPVDELVDTRTLAGYRAANGASNVLKYNPGKGTIYEPPTVAIKSPVSADLAGAVTAGTKIINQPATDTLTVAEIMGTVVTNYGQTEANTQTLPSTADVITAVGPGVEVAFIVQIRTAGAGAFHLKAGSSDAHYFDDGTGTVTALTDGDKISIATPAVGDTLVVTMIQTGEDAWDWLTTCTRGTATDGGA